MNGSGKPLPEWIRAAMLVLLAIVAVLVVMEMKLMNERLTTTNQVIQEGTDRIAGALEEDDEADPGIGPIITVEPKENANGDMEPEWKVEYAKADPGDPNTLRTDFINPVHFFMAKASGMSARSNIKSLKIIVKDNGGQDTCEIKKLAGKFKVFINNALPNPCDFDAGSATPPCVKSGIPAECFGELVDGDGDGTGEFTAKKLDDTTIDIVALSEMQWLN